MSTTKCLKFDNIELDNIFALNTLNPSDLKDYETNKSAKLANGVTMSHWVRAPPLEIVSQRKAIVQVEP